MARTQQKRRQTRKVSKKIPDDERQAEIADVHNKLGLTPNVRNKLGLLPDVDEVFYEADTTKETDTTKQAADPNLKDAIDIDSNDNNDQDDEDEEDINVDTKDDGDVEDNNT